MAKGSLWVHGMPARDLAQVEDFLNGDAHDQSKVQWFDGNRFHDIHIVSTRLTNMNDAGNDDDSEGLY